MKNFSRIENRKREREEMRAVVTLLWCIVYEISQFTQTGKLCKKLFAKASARSLAKMSCKECVMTDIPVHFIKLLFFIKKL